MDLHILGIDVSKLKFNVCLIREDGRLKHRLLAHTLTGFSELSAWLKKNHLAQVHACLEATGTYWAALATYLSDNNHQVSVVNPAATKAYAGAQLSRTKTSRCRVERTLLPHTKAAVMEASPAGSARTTGTCPQTRLAHRDAYDGAQQVVERSEYT
jgi:transposase